MRFEAEQGATRVSIEHRGWQSLPPDHAARHGLKGASFEYFLGSWWADLIQAAQRLAQADRD